MRWIEQKYITVCNLTLGHTRYEHLVKKTSHTYLANIYSDINFNVWQKKDMNQIYLIKPNILELKYCFKNM